MNTIPEKLIKGAFPTIEMKRSPYLLSPYMNTKPFRPLGQVELVCERGGKFHPLLFQVIADKDIGDKPALISGEDSEATQSAHPHCLNVYLQLQILAALLKLSAVLNICCTHSAAERLSFSI